MPKVFGHAAKFGTTGKVFGSIMLTKEQLVEAQKRLEIVRLEEKQERLNSNWLAAKKQQARIKLKLDQL